MSDPPAFLRTKRRQHRVHELCCVGVSGPFSGGVQPSRVQEGPGAVPAHSRGVAPSFHAAYGAESMCWSIGRRTNSNVRQRESSNGRFLACFRNVRVDPIAVRRGRTTGAKKAPTAGRRTGRCGSRSMISRQVGPDGDAIMRQVKDSPVERFRPMASSTTARIGGNSWMGSCVGSAPCLSYDPVGS